MQRLRALGLSQGVLPPHERPNIAWLRSLGFGGSDRDVWAKAWSTEPTIARAALASSAMWAANAATISPSADCEDGKLHASVANLQTMLHRLEAKKALRRIKKIATAFIFEAAVPRDAARRRLIDDFLAVFGGETQPIVNHLIEAGKLTLEDVQDAEKMLREMSKKGKKP